jgi:hypothetical protein
MIYKKFSILGLVLILTSCSADNFRYNRDKACVVNLGNNAFSVIFDNDETLIKRNRNVVFNSEFTIRTDNKKFSTTDKYFYGDVVNEIIAELNKSDKIFVEYKEKTGEKGSSKFRTLIYGESFSKQIKICAK